MCNWLASHYDVLKDFAGPAIGGIGILATTVVALAGLRTFGRWRREKLEEKRIEVAIDALAIGYESEFVFDRIRSRLVRDFEYENMKLDEGNIIVKDRKREPQGGAYAVLRRIESHDEFFDKALKIEPLFIAIFGEGSKDIFALLHKARRTVETTAEALIDEYRIELDPGDEEGKERRRKWRSNIFASPGKLEGGDDVGKMLGEFRSKLERTCRPLIDRGYGRSLS
jgi:hypothetical protein